MVRPWYRRRWLKVLGGIIIVLAIAHTAATLVTGHQLARELQRLKAAGEPLTLAEMAPKPVLESENAAPLYEQAFLARQLSATDEDRLGVFIFKGVPRHKGVRPATAAEVEAMFRRNAAAFALIEEASRRAKCVLPTNWKAGYFAVEPSFRRLSYMKTLVRLVGYRAVLLASQEKPDEALALCRTMLRMSEHLASEPALLGHLTRTALQRMATATLEVVLKSSSPSLGACRQTFDAIAQIDDRAGLALALKEQRAAMIGEFRDLGAWWARMGPPGMHSKEVFVFRVYGSYFLRPLRNADEVAFLRNAAEAIQQAKGPYSRDARRAFLEFAKRWAGVDVATAYRQSFWRLPISAMQDPVQDRAALATDRVDAELRLAQVALAAKAYRVEKGAYPASLADLRRVVDWRLPNDPFTSKPLLYHHQGEGFIVYSIGPNLKDDGGKPPDIQHGTSSWGGDIVWRVER